MAKKETTQVQTEDQETQSPPPESARPEGPPPEGGWEGMSVPQLQKLCRARNLCRTGEKPTLINRLRAHDRPGRAGKFTGGGAVKCRACGAPALVTSSKVQTLDGGKQVRVRTVRCEGKKAHKEKLVDDI